MKKFFLVLFFSFIFMSASYAGYMFNLPNTTSWYYIQDDNTLAINKWVNYNGKYYYFDTNGLMLINTITPDGYTVGIDGSWIVNAPQQQNQLQTSNTVSTVGTSITSSSASKRELKNNILAQSGVSFVDTIRIGAKNWSNTIKLNGNNSYLKTNSGTYNQLTFEVGINNVNPDAEYLLSIEVNGQEAEEFTDFSDNGDTITINVDQNAEIMIIYSCVAESGKYLNDNSKSLYLRNAVFKKVK